LKEIHTSVGSPRVRSNNSAVLSVTWFHTGISFRLIHRFGASKLRWLINLWC
jgi:hypothetical protein